MKKTIANLCGIVSLAGCMSYWVMAYYPLGTGGHLRVLTFFGHDPALKIGLTMTGFAVLGIIAGVLGSRVWLLIGAWALTSLALGPSFKA